MASAQSQKSKNGNIGLARSRCAWRAAVAWTATSRGLWPLSRLRVCVWKSFTLASFPRRMATCSGVPVRNEPCLGPKQAAKMKSHTEYLTFNVPARMAFQNITPQVEEIVRKSGGQEGLLL